MGGAFVTVLHHAEAIDPTLADWLRHKIDDVLGLEPATIVIVLGVVLVLFPLVLGLLAIRSRRRLPR